jgi:hypothetical protein
VDIGTGSHKVTDSSCDHTLRRLPGKADLVVGNRNKEAGAVLILALVYIIAISLVVAALVDWTMNDLNNTNHFHNASALDYAVTGAVEVAVQSMRTNPNYSPSYPGTETMGTCWTPPSGESISQLTNPTSNYTVAVWCQTTQNLDSASTRVVTFYACQSTAAAASDSSSAAESAGEACMAPGADELTAMVTFDDYPPGGGPYLQTTCSGGACGQEATTTEWQWTNS